MIGSIKILAEKKFFAERSMYGPAQAERSPNRVSGSLGTDLGRPPDPNADCAPFAVALLHCRKALNYVLQI